MTRAITIAALIGFLVVGAAAASILGRATCRRPQPELAAAPPIQSPVANRQGKKDKLAVAASLRWRARAAAASPRVTQPLRLAFASTAAVPTPRRPPPPSPLAAGRRQSRSLPASRRRRQKPYALLSDAQIAGIKERLKLSAAQQNPTGRRWKTRLRAVARKIHATRQADPHATGAPIDPDCHGSPATEIGRDAAIVSAARRPKARSAAARPPDRAGKSRLADLNAVIPGRCGKHRTRKFEIPGSR